MNIDLDLPAISVGVMSANLMNLSGDLKRLSEAGVQLLHFDVMDGCFVPMMTAGPPYIRGIETGLIKDVHLMVKDPLHKVEDYVNAGADMITVHVESAPDILPVLEKLGHMKNKNNGDRKLIRGVAVNPGTPLRVLEPLLGAVEKIDMLAVNPTSLPMEFRHDIYDRCREVKEMISASPGKILLAVDGGIKRDNIEEIAGIGADIVVSGSAIFKNNAIMENYHFMMEAVRN
jgi:ribulose-phosphate 3-epimerase